VELRSEPFNGPEKLYYINLGGYDAGEFLEKHKNVFIVSSTVSEAKKRAIKEAKPWSVAHRDEMYEAEQAFSLSDVGSDRRLYVHLMKAAEVRDLSFTCNYTPIKTPRKPSAF
jgi:hypothetical protein